MEPRSQISRKGKHTDGASDISGPKLTKEKPTDGRQVEAKLLSMNKSFPPRSWLYPNELSRVRRGGCIVIKSVLKILH